MYFIIITSLTFWLIDIANIVCWIEHKLNFQFKNDIEVDVRITY